MNLAALVAAVAFAAAPTPQAAGEKERGDRLLENGDLAAAREAYDNALALSPEYAEAFNQVGFLLVKQEKREEAVGFFKKAAKADPRFALAHFNLGATLRKLGRHVEAIQAYRTYIELEPKDLSALFGLAEAYRASGDKPSALNAYERYLAGDQAPANQKHVEKAQAAAAQLRRELGAAVPLQAAAPQAAPSPAVAAETKSPPPAPAARSAAAPAQAEIPASAPAQPPLASAATAPGAPREEASAQPREPDRAGKAGAPRFKEAMELRAQGKHRESLFALQDAVNADPTNVQWVFELGVAYATLGYYPQAIVFWQRVTAMPTTDANRAAAEQNIEKARQKMAGTTAAPAAASTPAPASGAAPVSNLASPAAPAAGDGRAAYARALEAYGAAHYVEALREFDQAIAAKPDFAQAFSGRGSTYLAMGDYSRALADYAQAMRLDGAMAYPVFGVAEALMMLGRRADALRYYQAYEVSRAADVQPALVERARKRIAEIGR